MTDMQPGNSETSAAQAAFEQGRAGTAPHNGEYIPVLPTPEEGIEKGAERGELTADAAAAVADAASVGTATPAQAIPNDPAAILQQVSAGPATAADDDVIEKEWVDKAKKILAETKDDPNARAARVNELQKDYLKKRYGKELGATS